MASLTPNLSLKTYNVADGASNLFQTWRLDIDGTSASNMTKIDDWAGITNAAITTLQANRGVSYTPATYVSAYSYVATVSGITSYSTNLMISVSLDITNAGVVGLDINSLGVKYLQKISTVTGLAVNVEANDLRTGKEYLFRYNGSGWIWIDAVTIDQINVPGISGNILLINSNNTGSDSGYGFNGVSGVPTLSSGSVNLTQLPNHASSATGFGVATSASYGHIKIDTESGVPSITNGSISSNRIPIDGIVITNSAGSIQHGNSGVSPGTYTTPNIAVNALGHIIGASSAMAGHTIQDTGSSLANQPNLNFEGVGITVTNNTSGSSTDITVSNINENLLDNSGFLYFQRQTPETITNYLNDDYGADRWYTLNSFASGSVGVSRQTSTYPNQKYDIQLKQVNSGSARMGLAQIVESTKSYGERGRDVEFQSLVKTSVAADIYGAILTGGSLQGADVVVSDIVKDWVSTDFITPGGFFLDAASCGIITTGSVTAGSVGYSTMNMTGIMPANDKNLIAMIWTKDAQAQNFTLNVTQTGLYDGSMMQTWLPKDDLEICQQYYEKSYNIDVAPQTPNSNFGLYSAVGTATSTTAIEGISVSYKISKKKTPTITTYRKDGSATNPSYWRQDSTTYIPITIVTIGMNTFTAYLTSSGLTAHLSYGIDGHWTAESEL